jgi:hypothetical protein
VSVLADEDDVIFGCDGKDQSDIGSYANEIIVDDLAVWQGNRILPEFVPGVIEHEGGFQDRPGRNHRWAFYR